VKRNAFILTREWYDTRDGLELAYWAWTADGPCKIRVRSADAVCFINHDASLDDLHPNVVSTFRRKELKLKNLAGESVDGVYFSRQRDLMERFVTAGCEVHGEPIQRKGFMEYQNPKLQPSSTLPALTSVSVDIETSDIEGSLYSIAVSAAADERVFLVARKSIAALTSKTLEGDAPIEEFDSEEACLQAFFGWLERYDRQVTRNDSAGARAG